MFSLTVSPKDPIEHQPAIGIIGMGAMGKMYAKLLAKAGWKKYRFVSLGSDSNLT